MSATVATGPKGIITVTDPQGKIWKLGRMRNIQVSSQYQRDPVYGVGNVNPQELPLTRYMGTMSCDSYMMLTTRSMMRAFDFTIQDEQKFWRFLLFECGIRVDIVQEAKVDGEVVEVPVVTVSHAYITAENWTMQEGAIWGKSGQFSLLTAPRVLASKIPTSVTEDNVHRYTLPEDKVTLKDNM